MKISGRVMMVFNFWLILLSNTMLALLILYLNRDIFIFKRKTKAVLGFFMKRLEELEKEISGLKDE